MKAKILKTVLPALVLMLAVFGAFTFKNAGDKALLFPVTGWIDLPSLPCAVSVECDNSPINPVCTTIYLGIVHQAFGKAEPSAPCNRVVYRPQF